MDKCDNDKLAFLSACAKYDKRYILAKNLNFICNKTGVTEKALLAGEYSNFYCRNDILEHEQTLSMIIELNHGIDGFSQEEIKDILFYISTN